MLASALFLTAQQLQCYPLDNASTVTNVQCAGKRVSTQNKQYDIWHLLHLQVWKA